MARIDSLSQPAARSVQWFGLYLSGTGALLLLAPALLLAPLALPVPQDVWIRVAGVLALALGATDVLAAHAGSPLLWRATVWRRLAAGAVLLGLVATGIAPPAVVLFAAIDIAAACWTAWALRTHLASFSPGPATAPAAARADRKSA